ncbi:non-homologous end-joining DNA ligase [Streptomyces sp. NPDC005438]|uniref:non-homologous end-joining DNA ligase n=1 Tax=Streptomyces sp. NPDC005438 TaxID=3156880 RepID=UPI0033A5183B
MPLTVVEGRRLTLSNLEKVLYPRAGFTKGEALHYYARVAGALLPHLQGRPLSFVRYPDGVEGQRFFAKQIPPGTPEWVRTCEVRHSDGSTSQRVMIQDLASLIWAANLAALELHTPQWLAGAQAQADRLVLDLDPGAPATLVDCCAVAVWLRERLAEDGLRCHAKTSGAKGLHLLVPLRPTPSRTVSDYARSLARRAERALPDLALHQMARRLRAGRVFIDHSQNSQAKTTAAPYTLRAQPTPTVSTPVTWEEVESCQDPEELTFTAGDLPGRLERYGDLLGPLLNASRASSLP